MSENIAFLFPGQGSQYVEMGKDFYDNFAVAREYFDKANQVLDIDLKKLCFEGPEDELTETQNTQPAIFTVSMIAYEILKDKGVEPSMVAGHSLGEYTALCAAGVFDFETGLKLVRKRGELMASAVADGSKGTMAAIIALDREKIEEICGKVAGVCELANINSPMQIVISGEEEAVHTAMEKADEAGAKKIVELNVSSAFHSQLMEPAKNKLKEYIQSVQFKDPKVPVIANSTADFVKNKEEIVTALEKQLINPVRWVESMELMGENGIECALEVGPGRVLKSLMRRIDRSIKTYNIQDSASLEKAMKKI
ncbi:MAG TPA: ACP S-malonyltransferase [Halanaerobiales bacterium]|nr:ACP S-malonyltransferase [Halanaerobiales bacterium]